MNAVAGKNVALACDGDGQLSTVTQYASLTPDQQVATGSYHFDDAGRLTGLGYTQPNSTGLPSYSWQYDDAGRMTQSVNNTDGTVNYSNDATGQLTSADSTGTPSLDENHSYDPTGNRTNTGYSTGADNRLLSDGTYHYLYPESVTVFA
jgi:YD repeat-containing protein